MPGPQRAYASLPIFTVTFLFTDIEGSTRLWEQDWERMSVALARHDALARAAVEGHRGTVVKMTGDGMCAAFGDPADALNATLNLQQALADAAATNDVPLRVRCGLHTGIVERRDNDFFGPPVNRAARIMGAAHGGQVLLSQAVVESVQEILPAAMSLRDLGRVRLKDLSTPEHVYQVLHPALRQDFPALRSLETTPNNLPQQLTSFVGRESGLAEIKELLGAARLLTLLGMGGVGKTRLSLQTAADVLDDYPDGVWFVELASIADARLVPQAVASVVGVMEDAGHPVLEALIKFVKDRQLLVILDNCEHLVQACADLARQLLQTCTHLKVLTSSREPLHVPGETTYLVQPLALPDPHRAISMDALLQYEAVRLFVDRATTVLPDFEITPQSAGALAEICQRLDGIPLAIELAAARVRALSVERIAERLDERFRLLTGGGRTLLPRQQTLRALIDWSFDLLTEPERALLRRLAVFAGGWTLEAAEAVGADGEIAAADVLDLLASLVNKSLVVVEAGGERYRLLETVREYAHERLHGSGDANATRTRHLEFFLALSERAAPQLWGVDQGAWVSRLDLERENLLAAHTWCDRANAGAERGLQLINKLQLYWLPSGLIELGYRLTLEALARPGAQERNEARCGALYAASQLAYFMGRFRDVQGHGEESLSIAREIQNRVRAADALLMVGYAADELGQRAMALPNFEASIALARELGDRARLSFALNALAGYYVHGDPNKAIPLFEESLALAREVGDHESVAITLQNLARAFVGLARSDQGCKMVLESLGIAQQIGSRRVLLDALHACAALAATRADWARAARFLGTADEELARLGLQRLPGDEAFLAPFISRAREELGATTFASEEAAARAISHEEAIAEARRWLGSEA